MRIAVSQVHKDVWEKAVAERKVMRLTQLVGSVCTLRTRSENSTEDGGLAMMSG